MMVFIGKLKVNYRCQAVDVIFFSRLISLFSASSIHTNSSMYADETVGRNEYNILELSNESKLDIYSNRARERPREKKSRLQRNPIRKSKNISQ